MAITRSQQAKQMLQDGGMLVKPGFGGTRQGYRGVGEYGGGDEGPATGQGPAGDGGREDRRAGQYGSPEGKAVADRDSGKGGFSLDKLPSVRLAKFVVDKLGKFGRRGFNPDDLLGTPDFQGTRSSVDDDDDSRGEEAGIRSAMRFNPMTTAASMMNPMTPQQGIGALDLNRIAYRFMADGGFLEDTDEARQAYGLGSIVKKAFKTVRKPFKAVTKTLKKVAKSPTGRLLLAVAAPYALGPAVASSAALSGLTAAQQAALISGATTGITQLASGEDLDLKDIALSAAIGGASAKAFPAGGSSRAVSQAPRGPAELGMTTRGAIGTPGFKSSLVDEVALTGGRAFTGPQELGLTAQRAAKESALAQSLKPTAFTSADRRRELAGIRSITDAAKKTDPSLLKKATEGLAKLKDSKLTDILLRNKDGKIDPFKAIALTTGITGLLAAKEQEQEDEFGEIDRGPGIDIAAIRRRPFDTLAPRFGGSQFDFYAAEGGRAKKEPVAKKVMPLLDMGGMEKDYRAEGGFVPIGRMEKADDVPARLSKNEFVFTADAVRNAGEGDVDKGAEVMYNMMKNLEAGGEVSEESQGLKGARRMFQTSQRLEEVL
jgi:hypothetical protein